MNKNASMILRCQLELPPLLPLCTLGWNLTTHAFRASNYEEIITRIHIIEFSSSAHNIMYLQIRLKITLPEQHDHAVTLWRLTLLLIKWLFLSPLVCTSHTPANQARMMSRSSHMRLLHGDTLIHMTEFPLSPQIYLADAVHFAN